MPGKRGRPNGAEDPIFGDEIGSLGEPFGKELTLFNLEDLARDGNGCIQAKFIKSFGNYQMPMGVETMSEEVIVCNMNNGTVEFTDFDGNTQLTLPPKNSNRGPKKFQEPSVATILLDCRILVGDKGGCHVYNGTGEYQKTVKPKQMLGGKMYGILPVRRNGGQVGFICEKPNGDGLKYVFYDNTLSKQVSEAEVDFEDNDRHAVRFSACLGNSILLSDMNKIHQGVWVTDLNGNVRCKVGDGQKDDKGNFIQAAGVCFDNRGNFLAICSKSSRITAFRADGNVICELQFPEGAIQRPSDLSVNDDGKMAVVALTGQCFMFDLKPGNPNQDWPTAGPKPPGGYQRGRGGGRGRGRGGGRGGDRGSSRGRGGGRGRGRGNFNTRY